MKHDYKQMEVSYSVCDYIEEIAYMVPVNIDLEIEIHCPKVNMATQKRIKDAGEARGLFSEEATPVQKIGYRELTGLIAKLPPDARTIFNMFVIEGYSHKEIAQTLGLNEATTRSKLQRARIRLQEMIKGLEK